MTIISSHTGTTLGASNEGTARANRSRAGWAVIGLFCACLLACSGGVTGEMPETGSPSPQDSGGPGPGSGSGSSGSGASGSNSSGSSSGDPSGSSGGSGAGSSSGSVGGGSGASSGADANTPGDATAPPDDAGSPDSFVAPEASTIGGFRPCPAGKPCAIMPLGDSITYGYIPHETPAVGGGYRMELFALAGADNHSITFVGSQMNGPTMVGGKPFPQGNEGYSGYTIDPSVRSGLSPLVDQAIATYKPNIVLLMIGTNDMHYSVDLPNAPTRLGNLLDRITKDKGDALVVVAKIVAANGAQNASAITYNAAIPGIVQSRVAQGKHIVVVDMYTALGPWSTSTNFGDSEHPNVAGYSLMAKTWYAAISSVLP